MATTLLEHLTQPNPLLDCTRSANGPNTFNPKWDYTSGLVEWKEFNYATLAESYGNVLTRPLDHSLSPTSPPLSELEKEIFNEDTFEHLLSRSIIPEVRAALQVAWPICCPDNAEDIVDIGRGGCAKRATLLDDSRLYPDWAGVRKSQTTSLGYKNLCPGETKLATKWNTSERGQLEDDFALPFMQIQTYCARHAEVCHGWLITPEELVVVQVSREIIGPGLAHSRTARTVPQPTGVQPSHNRNFSTETMSSGFEIMSLDRSSSYHESENSDFEYGNLLWKSVPWQAAGKNTLTVKLALWWIYMLTKNDISVKTGYAPLTTWGARTGADVPDEESSISASFSRSEPSANQVTMPDSPQNTQSRSTRKDKRKTPR